MFRLTCVSQLKNFNNLSRPFQNRLTTSHKTTESVALRCVRSFAEKSSKDQSWKECLQIVEAN